MSEQRRTIRIDDELWASAIDLAAAKDRNVAEEVRLALIAHLRKHGYVVADSIPARARRQSRQEVRT